MLLMSCLGLPLAARVLVSLLQFECCLSDLVSLLTPLCSTLLQFEIVLLLGPFSGSMFRGVLDRHLEGLKSGLECHRVARELRGQMLTARALFSFLRLECCSV